MGLAYPITAELPCLFPVIYLGVSREYESLNELSERNQIDNSLVPIHKIFENKLFILKRGMIFNIMAKEEFKIGMLIKVYTGEFCFPKGFQCSVDEDNYREIDGKINLIKFDKNKNIIELHIDTKHFISADKRMKLFGLNYQNLFYLKNGDRNEFFRIKPFFILKVGMLINYYEMNSGISFNGIVTSFEKQENGWIRKLGLNGKEYIGGTPSAFRCDIQSIQEI